MVTARFIRLVSCLCMVGGYVRVCLVLARAPSILLCWSPFSCTLAEISPLDQEVRFHIAEPEREGVLCVVGRGAVNGTDEGDGSGRERENETDRTVGGRLI